VPGEGQFGALMREIWRRGIEKNFGILIQKKKKNNAERISSVDNMIN